MRAIFGDTETTGIDEHAGVVEVAWLETDIHMNVVSSAYSLINPGMPINPSASGVHGITNKDVENSPTMQDFVGDSLRCGDILLIAHNVQFDLRFFGPYIGTLVGTLCTLKMARLIYPDAENHKLPTLRYYLALDSGESHSADGDVKALFSLAQRMMSDTGMSLLQLWELSQQPIIIDKMPFGKHKGTALRDLPRGYKSWLLGLQDLDDNLRYSLEAL